jgi:hypothetical protein
MGLFFISHLARDTVFFQRGQHSVEVNVFRILNVANLTGMNKEALMNAYFPLASKSEIFNISDSQINLDQFSSNSLLTGVFLATTTTSVHIRVRCQDGLHRR